MSDEKFIGCIVGMLVGFGIACFLLLLSMSHDDVQEEQSLYCQMVKEKTWPDYKKIYEKACTNENE